MTDLIGDESLDAEETGCGLDGAENMGQDGDRGEFGLEDDALKSHGKCFGHHGLVLTIIIITLIIT